MEKFQLFHVWMCYCFACASSSYSWRTFPRELAFYSMKGSKIMPFDWISPRSENKTQVRTPNSKHIKHTSKIKPKKSHKFSLAAPVYDSYDSSSASASSVSSSTVALFFKHFPHFPHFSCGLISSVGFDLDAAAAARVRVDGLSWELCCVAASSAAISASCCCCCWYYYIAVYVVVVAILVPAPLNSRARVCSTHVS